MKPRHIIHLAIILSLSVTSCSTLEIAPPTPTSTSVPTNTPTSPNTSHSMVATSSVKLEKQADGTWMYYDNAAGFQFRLGSNWYLEDVSLLSLEEIVERVPKIRTELGLKTTAVQYSLEPQGMRVLGVYLDETIPDYSTSTFNTAYIVDEDFAQMSLQEIQNSIIKMWADYYKKDPQEFIPQISTNDHGLEYGAIIFNLSLNYLHMKIFFKTHDGIGLITFGFSDKNIDFFGPDWALLGSSLRYTNP